MPFDPQIRGTVRVLTADSAHGRVYVGGRFTLGAEKTSVSLATIDEASGAVSHWGPVANSGVWSIAPSADGSVVYVGGAFATLDAKARRRIGATDANGALLPFNPGANGVMRAIVPAADVVFAGGQFGSIGGEAHRGLASLDAVTGKATGWDAGADGNVLSLALVGDVLYAAGDFSTIGGKSRNGVAALDAGAGAATRWDVSPDDVVRSLAVSPDGSRLVAAGDFTRIAGGFRDLAEFDVGSGFLTDWDPDAPFAAYSIAYSGDGTVLYVGGDGAFVAFR